MALGMVAKPRKSNWDFESAFHKYNAQFREGGVTRRLAENVAGLEYCDIPLDVLELGKMMLLDALGCILSGSTQASSRKALRYVRSLGCDPQSTVAVHGDRTHAYYAALLNGSFCHAWAFDDSLGQGLSGEGAVVPVVLALSEWQMRNGHDILTAVIAGLEVICRVAAAAPLVPLKRPLDPVSAFGPWGAAAAATKILGSDANDVENAFTLTSSQAAATLQPIETGGESFRLHTGFAAMHGLRVANLARLGLSGAREILEGPEGFLMCISGIHPDGRPKFDAARVNEGFGKQWILKGVTLKKYPVESSQLGLIETLTRMKEAHNIRPEDVDEIEICQNMGSGRALSSSRLPANEDLLATQYSAVWGASMAMVLGSNDIKSYRDNVPPNGKSSEIAEFAKRVKILNSDAESGKNVDLEKVIIKLRNGMTNEASVAWPRGDYLHNPMTWEELEDKFRAQAQLGEISITQQDRVIDIVKNLEEQDDTTALVSSLVRRTEQQ